LKLLQTFLDSNGLDLKKNAATLPFPQKAVMVYLSYSLIWSLGANLHESSRSKFGIALRVEMKKRFSEFPDGDVFEYGIDTENHQL